MIHDEINCLDFQLKNIFASAEIEAGESALKVSSVELTTLINNVIDAFQNQTEKKKINLSVLSNIKHNVLFTTDPEKLYLILSNILSNAIIFNKENGDISINYHIENNHLLVIKIRDSGIGISDENKERIFDRFNQLDKGMTKLFSGHGLGLSVTKELLELISGSMEIYSKLNEGSSFIIKINQLENDDTNNYTSSFNGNDFFFENKNDGIFK